MDVSGVVDRVQEGLSGRDVLRDSVSQGAHQIICAL
jgi:hypothetical protein